MFPWLKKRKATTQSDLPSKRADVDKFHLQSIALAERGSWFSDHPRSTGPLQHVQEDAGSTMDILSAFVLCRLHEIAPRIPSYLLNFLLPSSVKSSIAGFAGGYLTTGLLYVISVFMGYTNFFSLEDLDMVLGVSKYAVGLFYFGRLLVLHKRESSKTNLPIQKYNTCLEIYRTLCKTEIGFTPISDTAGELRDEYVNYISISYRTDLKAYLEDYIKLIKDYNIERLRLTLTDIQEMVFKKHPQSAHGFVTLFVTCCVRAKSKNVVTETINEFAQMLSNMAKLEYYNAFMNATLSLYSAIAANSDHTDILGYITDLLTKTIYGIEVRDPDSHVSEYFNILWDDFDVTFRSRLDDFCRKNRNLCELAIKKDGEMDT